MDMSTLSSDQRLDNTAEQNNTCKPFNQSETSTQNNVGNHIDYKLQITQQ